MVLDIKVTEQNFLRELEVADLISWMTFEKPANIRPMEQYTY